MAGAAPAVGGRAVRVLRAGLPAPASESIRFFYVDRAWTDALVQGASSVGTVNSADRAQLEQMHRTLREEIDEDERLVRLPGGEPAPEGTGRDDYRLPVAFARRLGLARRPRARVSPRVVGDDEIVPESHPDRIKVLRLERLAPAVLLALFDGVPRVVHVEEPRQGVQFGIILEEAGGPNEFSARVAARDVTTSETHSPERPMPIAFRPGAPGVLDLRRTAQEFLKPEHGTNMGTEVDGAEFALQMIRFPYRQVFGDPEGEPQIEEVFRPSIGLAVLKARFEEALR